MKKILLGMYLWVERGHSVREWQNVILPISKIITKRHKTTRNVRYTGSLRGKQSLQKFTSNYDYLQINGDYVGIFLVV